MYAEGVRRRALPTPQAHDMKGAPGASAQDAGGFQSSLPAEVRRRALPTPTTTDDADRDYQTARGVDYPTLGHAAKAAAGVESQMHRRALPTPKAADGRAKGNGGARKSPGLDQLARRRALPTPTRGDGERESDRFGGGNLTLAGAVRKGESGRLSPALPEWMMSFPPEWSLPDGPPLVDAPSRPMLPDMTAVLGLTTEKEHRRDRLRCLGNACDVTVAEFIAREVLS